MNRVLSILMVALVMVASVGALPVPNHPKSQIHAKSATTLSSSTPKPYQVGNASWYGKKFHGKTTASGEDFDMFELTAAHRQLPLGSFVKVTNLRNGKWIIVRVNDRGPYVGRRIMDLSYGAARMLDFHAGVEKVRLDIVESEPLAASDQGLTQ
jgi:rare lipoprotein A